jgi:hypothetical protein
MDLLTVLVFAVGGAFFARWLMRSATNTAPANGAAAEEMPSEISLPERVEDALVAARQGDPDAMLALAGLYAAGEGGATQDYARAFEWASRAVDAGSTDALLPLATMYRRGRGTARDDAKALELYLRLARGGNAEAMVAAGWMLCRGLGAPADEKAGRALMDQAEQTGRERDLTRLGDIYLSGDGVDADPARAMRLYAQAAEDRPSYFDIDGLPKMWQPDPFAMIALGRMHALGIGTAPDPDRATDFFSMALATRDPEAADALARMFREGDCVPKDAEIAARLEAQAVHEMRHTMR